MQAEAWPSTTDRYSRMLECKGSQVPLNSPYIIFTCPKSMKDEFSWEKEDLAQLERRIIEINLDIESPATINLRSYENY